jgi:sarcosine reductase
MRLTFGSRTGYDDGLLTICREELVGLISRDGRFRRVDIEIAHPGEGTRITNVLEITEPRIKEGDKQTYYPGMVGDLYRAGEGTTNVLSGCAVLELGVMPGFPPGLVDMAGEGAAYSPFSGTHNICLVTEPAPGVDRNEYGQALMQAGLETSVYLARSTLGLSPHEVEVFDPENGPDADPGLPAIGYLFQLHSHGEWREPFVYGDNSRRYYPTILHPNEILDGAIVCGHYTMSFALKNITYSLLNHPVILDLYKKHGRELNFKGVVISPEPTSLREIRRSAIMAASLLKNVLKVAGAIITKEGGGHTDVDVMQNCDECERIGIKTAIIDNEFIGPDGAGELPLLAVSPNADAIVSVGNFDGLVRFSPMDRNIGGDMADMGGDLKGELSAPVRYIPNGVSQVGLTCLTTEMR